MAVLYVKEQGSLIQKRGERLLVTKQANTLLDVPIIKVENISVIGNVQITAQALHMLMERGIDISHFSYSGMYLGHTASDASKNIFLRFERIYETFFSESTYAYRSNKSALNAVEVIGEQIEKKKYSFIVKADIAHFFDTINFSKLKSVLEKRILEEDVIYLIEENTKSAMLDDTGELIEKRSGIYQGSGISPILSNIYLLEFDHWLSEQGVFYVRYSDDMLFLGNVQTVR